MPQSRRSRSTDSQLELEVNRQRACGYYGARNVVHAVVPACFKFAGHTLAHMVRQPEQRTTLSSTLAHGVPRPALRLSSHWHCHSSCSSQSSGRCHELCTMATTTRSAHGREHSPATSPSACCSGEGLPASVTAGSGGGTLKQSNLRQPQSAVLPVQERQVGPVGYSLDKGQKLLAEAGGDPSGPSSTKDWCGEGGEGCVMMVSFRATASARNETHPVPVPSTYASSKEPRARGRGERAYTTSMQIGHTQRLVTGSGWHHTACGPSSTC